jgi:RNA polymerase sigma factor (sigma-70 family)
MAAEDGTVTARDLTDNELMSEVESRLPGWEDHFESLYERYRWRLIRYFLVRGLTFEDAEDGAGSCFYRVLESVGGPGAFRSDLGLFRSWLFTIAHNEWINIIRGKGKLADSTDADDEEGARDILEDLASMDQPVDAALEKQELIELLHTCIATLTAKEREIIALRLQEMSHREIAQLLSISENFSMVRHCLALGKLKKCFFDQLAIRRICR